MLFDLNYQNCWYTFVFCFVFGLFYIRISAAQRSYLQSSSEQRNQLAQPFWQWFFLFQRSTDVCFIDRGWIDFIFVNHPVKLKHTQITNIYKHDRDTSENAIFVLFNFFFFYSLSPNKFFYYYYYYFSLHRFSNHLRLEHVLRLDLILNFLSRWYFDLYMRETLMACEIHQVKLFVYLIWCIYVLFFFLRTGRSVRDLRECHQRRGGSMHVCHGN